jgi:hypothetical protein
VERDFEASCDGSQGPCNDRLRCKAKELPLTVATLSEVSGVCRSANNFDRVRFPLAAAERARGGERSEADPEFSTFHNVPVAVGRGMMKEASPRPLKIFKRSTPKLRQQMVMNKVVDSASDPVRVSGFALSAEHRGVLLCLVFVYLAYR